MEYTHHIGAWAFSQDGFATLIAGLLAFIVGLAAVLAAGIVGWRQATILAAQNDIQKAQAGIASASLEIAKATLDLEKLKVKSDLFERRLEVYEATQDYLAYIVRHAEIPGSGRGEGKTAAARQESNELRNDYVQAMDKSKFLFRPTVYGNLNAIWKDANKLNLHNVRIERGDGDRGQRVESVTELLMKFAGLLENLSPVFGDELRLGAMDEPTAATQANHGHPVKVKPQTPVILFTPKG